MSKVTSITKTPKVDDFGAKNWADLKAALLRTYDDTDLVKTNEFSQCHDNGSSLSFVVDEMTVIHISQVYYSVIAFTIDGENDYVANEWFGNYSKNVGSDHSYNNERNTFIQCIKNMFERYYTYQIRWENSLTNQSGCTDSVYTKKDCLWEIERFGEHRDRDLPASNDGVKYTLRRAYHVMGKIRWHRVKLRSFKNTDLPVSYTA